MSERPIALAVTGASGACYAFRLLEVLLGAGRAVQLVVSSPARMVLAMEEDLKLPAGAAGIRATLGARLGAAALVPLSIYAVEDWMAPIASGSNPPAAMVVCPCTSGTLAGIAAGYSRNLIERAAEVALKERRPLILVPRETPVSVIQLENMLRLARAGAVILPANPGFYHRPEGLSGVIDFVVARILDQLGIEHHLLPRWGAQRGAPNDDD